MQRPTLQNVRIRSTRDAIHVFYAVARNVLPLITRRLDAEERRSIMPGNVYVWEERSANSEATGLGMERWTDGMGWGPSRVRDEFLFYHQKESDINDDPNNPATPWAQMMSMYPTPRSRASSDSERLIKQTYSVRVSLPPDQPRGVTRKWHLTAYFSQQKLQQLNTIDDVPGVTGVLVPEGWFRSARAAKPRRDDDSSKSATAKPVSQALMEGIVPTTGLISESTFCDTGSSTPPMPSYTRFPVSEKSNMPDCEPLLRRKTAYSLPSTTDYFGTIHPSNANAVIYQPTTPFTSPHMAQCRNASPLYYYSSPPSPQPSHLSHPRSSPSSIATTPSPRLNHPHLSDQLVPLEYLKTLSYPRRDPIDEQFLQRFSSQNLTTVIDIVALQKHEKPESSNFSCY